MMSHLIDQNRRLPLRLAVLVRAVLVICGGFAGFSGSGNFGETCGNIGDGLALDSFRLRDLVLGQACEPHAEDAFGLRRLAFAVARQRTRKVAAAEDRTPGQ
jgi:hypothetical protein